MRILPLLVLALAGCGQAEDAPVVRADAAQIECRLGRGAGFERVCTLEKAETERGREMIVRRPDGGFRRLIASGAQIEAADGAVPARATRLDDGRTEVEIGADAFRVPPWAPE